MSKTVIGFFNTPYDAQVAVEQLAAKGLSNQSIDISRGQRQDQEEHKPNKVSEFFNRLFGGESDDARRYSAAASRELTIVTVHAANSEQAEDVADVLDDCGAVDVDEPSDSDYRSENRAGSNDYSGRSSSPAYTTAGSSGTVSSDRQNLAASQDYSGSMSPEPNSADDLRPTGMGPGAGSSNSEYVDERSYPGDRFSGGAPVNDDQRSRNNDGMRDRRFDEETTRSSSIPSDSRYMAANRDTVGEDMTNDGISSPDDDQRVIRQDDQGRSSISDNTENTGLETPVPSAREQLERAKRRSRIIDSRVDNDYRLRD